MKLIKLETLLILLLLATVKIDTIRKSTNPSKIAVKIVGTGKKIETVSIDKIIPVSKLLSTIEV